MAKPSPAAPRRLRAPSAWAEAVEGVGQERGREPVTGVEHLDPDSIVGLLLDDDHIGPLRREADGVVEQVPQDPPQRLVVADHGPGPIDLGHDHHVLGQGNRGHRLHRLVDQLGQIERLQPESQRTGVGPSQQEQVADQGFQSQHVAPHGPQVSVRITHTILQRLDRHQQ